MSGWTKCAAAALAIVALAPPALAETRTAQSSISESGEGEDYVVRIVNATFTTDLVFAPDFATSRNVTYEQRITSEEAAGREGITSELEVTARSEGKELWRIKDEGNEGAPLGEYYRTTEWGCCGAENTHRSYSAWTGKLAFTATADPLFLAIPNTPVRRAVAYLSAYSVGGIDGERYPRGAGLLVLVDGDRTVDRVLLEADEGTGYEWTPELELSDPTGEHQQNGDTFDFWSADGKPDPVGLTGIDLMLTWDAEMSAYGKIPIVAGKFDIEHAELGDSLSLRRLGN